MEVAVFNIDGKETGRKVTLNETIFGIEPNDHAIYLDTKQYLAGQRQGTHKAKERGEVMGSTRKLKRQKGTGTARFGSIKNPQFRGGGRIFGPRPRFYGFKLNKKVKQLARKSALSYKAKENRIIILEDLSANPLICIPILSSSKLCFKMFLILFIFCKPDISEIKPFGK